MYGSNFSYGQTSTKKDTIYVNDESFEEQAVYGARDSIFIDLKENKIHLYGDAYLDYLQTAMKAGYIMVDLKKNEVLASYVYGKDSTKIESPKFKNGAEEIEASRIRYNFTTEKGYIEEVKIKQDEIYLYMGIAKRQSNGDIHFKQGRFSTCEFIEDPHYHFQLSKAIMIPDKRIVTGPMNLWIKGVPTPLGLPFSVIPQSKTRTHGLLIPQLVPFSDYGFGVRDLGYYFPINPTIQTSAFVTLFNRGSWGVKNTTDYFKKYKNKGTFTVSYQNLNLGFPTKKHNTKFAITWTHQKDIHSNPFWSFSSNVNFTSDNNTKNSLDPINPQYFNNQLNSDINTVRIFPGKPITMGMKISLRQNTQNKTFSLISPIFTMNITRFSPFKNIVKGKSEFQQMISRIAMSYNLESKNTSTLTNQMVTDGDFKQIQNQFINGATQNATLQTTVGFFKNTWKLNPSINYSTRYNFQQIEKIYTPNDTIARLQTILHQKAGSSQDFSLNASLTTVVYSYYRFIGKSKPLLRHILTPSFGFRYIPNLNQNTSLDTGTVKIATIHYSPFERSAYSTFSTNNQALVTFGFNNTFELKRKSEKDTITGFKKTKIIDQLSISGQYDLLKDSMKLSNLGISMRTSPFPNVSFVANTTLSPYDWIDSTGKSIGKFAYDSRNKIGRLLETSFATTYTLTSKESKQKLNDLSLKTPAYWSADYTYYSLHPERIIDFSIPWKINFTHNYSITANTDKTISNNRNNNTLNTVTSSFDANFTKRWKIIGSVNVDVKTAKITYSTITLTRDMHCWNLMFYWIPIGGNKSFVFSLRSTSNMFKDAKLDLKKPPLFL